jgi:hypothetical protein
VNSDLASLVGDIGGALAFGISSFTLLRVTLKDTARERARWLKFLSDNSDRNLRAIYGLEKALNDLNHTLERQRNDSHLP